MGKESKKVSRAVRKAMRNEWPRLFNEMCDDPLRARIKLAARIIFKRKV